MNKRNETFWTYILIYRTSQLEAAGTVLRMQLSLTIACEARVRVFGSIRKLDPRVWTD